MSIAVLSEPEVSLELALEHGLTEEEYGWVLDALGRTPTFVELGIYSVMWSEHCSYKNSISLLKKLPRDGDTILPARKQILELVLQRRLPAQLAHHVDPPIAITFLQYRTLPGTGDPVMCQESAWSCPGSADS